jgi:hypothetical protein
MIIVAKTVCDNERAFTNRRVWQKPGDGQAEKPNYCDKVNITSMGAITSTG